MRWALQYMLPERSGRIIAMSSIEGKQGKAGLAAYTANKHAINGLVKAVAREVGEYGITVNAICPGIVVTDILQQRAGRAIGLSNVDEVVALYTRDTALKRAVTAEEVASLALLLASEDGAAITGGTISIDGGAAYY
ncbi:MAG: SDR family oxidoreductase [Dehalococcoidia bacterium]|nr:SDR family oxidoreductase [Dehalococcoidia bacterium]